jgi:PIN domain nuclease of toxin-antitoxin system
MRLLLDTHIWIWAQETPEKFGRHTRGLLEDLGNGVSVSAIAALEIARLVFLHRLQLTEPASVWIADSVRSLGAQMLDVTPQIAAEAYELPGSFHKDPADRVLVATARLHNLTLLTADNLILRYPHVKTLRASA